VEGGLSELCIDGLRAAAVVHDIVKMVVPIQVLNRPGKLNEQELIILKTLPEKGYNTALFSRVLASQVRTNR
jgi:putative two-component system response regulator